VPFITQPENISANEITSSNYITKNLLTLYGEKKVGKNGKREKIEGCLATLKLLTNKI